MDARPPASARRLTAGLLVGAPVLLLVLFTLGGLTEERETGIPTVPFVTLLSLPLDIWIRDLAAALTVGLLLVGLVLAPRPDRSLARKASLAAVVWAVAVLCQSVLTVSEVLALPLGSSVDTTRVWSLVAQTDLGQVMLGQFALALVVALLAWVVQTRVAGLLLVLLVAIAAWLPGLTGHSGIQEGHAAASIGLGLHLVFASVWVGGLVATAVYAGSGAPGAGVVLRRFSVVALVSVVVIAETGLLNAALRLDGVASLVTSAYGTIILAKVTVLIVLIGWGWRHRRAIAKQWDAHQGVTVLDARFRGLFLRWGAWELLWMGVVYGLSVALSRTAPPGPAYPGDRVTAGAITLLVLGLPMAVGFINARALRAPALAYRYPETAAVAAILAIVIAGVGVPSALAEVTVGAQIGALIGAVLLVAAGWVLVTVLSAGPALPATIVAMAAWPVAIWWIERDALGGLNSGTWATVLLAEGLLAWLSFRPRRSSTVETPMIDDGPMSDDGRAVTEVTSA